MGSTRQNITKTNIDPYLCLLTLIFLGIGFAAVMTASVYTGQRLLNDPYFFIHKHGLALIIGFVFLYLASKIRIDLIFKGAEIGLVFFTLLLLLLFIPGLGKTANGATSWFDLYFFSFQPSEPVKIILIIFLVKYLTRTEDNQAQTAQNTGLDRRIFAHAQKPAQDDIMAHIWFFIRPVLFVLPAVMLVVLQPDLGTALLLILIILTTLFLTGLPIRFLLLLPLVFLPLIYIFLYKIEKNWRRVMAFLDPFADPTSKGYQLVQSLTAFYHGGPWGRGLGNGIQKRARLPESQTDFIFAAVAEELGLLWSLGLLALFIFLIIRVWMIVSRVQNQRNKVFAYALLSIILIQVVINIAVVTASMPVTGIPLPFISYGGSNLITMMIIMGLLCNISRQAQNP